MQSSDSGLGSVVHPAVPTGVKNYGTLSVRPAQAEDAPALAPKLREADRQELSALTSLGPLEALSLALKCSSIAYAVEDASGEVVALFGVAPGETPDMGSVWLLGSDALATHRFTFLRHSREWLKVLFSSYRLLGNIVDARNTLHVQWLRWLGFKFLCKRRAGRNGEEFWEFIALRGA